jgi:hypothetical protein
MKQDLQYSDVYSSYLYTQEAPTMSCDPGSATPPRCDFSDQNIVFRLFGRSTLARCSATIVQYWIWLQR